MPANLYLIDPKIPFEQPPVNPEPDAPFMPPPGPGIEPEVPNKPSPDNVPDLPDRPEPDPEVPKPQGTDT